MKCVIPVRYKSLYTFINMRSQRKVSTQTKCMFSLQQVIKVFNKKASYISTNNLIDSKQYDPLSKSYIKHRFLPGTVYLLIEK